MDKARMAWAMMRYKMKYADGVALYGKYVGNWGGAVTSWRFDALRNGKVIASRTLAPSCKLHLDTRVSSETLHEDSTWDMAAVRIRILDENGNIAPYAQLPLTFELSGAVQLIGPDTVTAEGGMSGTYLRTIGKTGAAELTIRCGGLDPVTLRFTVK